MPDRLAIESSWSLGIVRDLPRHMIPPGGHYDLLDFLVERGGMIYKRGGTSYQSAALPAQDDIIGIAAPEFPGDPRLVAFGSDSVNTTLFDITTDTPAAGVDCNSAELLENPPLYVDRLIICDGAGLYPPQKAKLNTGVVAVTDLGGTPPTTAKYSTVHNGRLILANGSVGATDYPNRVWFSDPLDAENDWDLDDGYIDVAQEITGLASVQGVLLVFSRGHYERILGDIPPGYDVPVSLVNTVLQPASNTGCIDARSLAYDGNVVFCANENGVYAVTGAGDTCLTTKPGGDGIGVLWQDTIQDFAPALGSVVCCGTLRDHLFVSVRRRFEEADPQRDQFLCYLPSQAWTRLSADCGAHMYATRYAPVSALYSGVSSETDNRARNLTGIFTPTADNKQDADGTDVEPLWESPTMGLMLGVQRRHFYDFGDKHYDLGQLSYVLEDAATDAPELDLTMSGGIEASTAYLPLPESPLPVAATMSRKRIAFGTNSTGLTLKVQQDGPSATTEIHMLELTVRSLDPGGGGE